MSDEKHPLELRVEEIASKPPVKQRDQSEILNEILAHEGMMKLFQQLKTTPIPGRILFLHPLDLFGREGRYQSPYLYYGKCMIEKQKGSHISRALDALQIDHKVQTSLGLSKALAQIGMSTDEQETLGRDFADAVLYALVMLFRISPVLRELVQSQEFNYKTLRALVKDYSHIVDEKELEEVVAPLLTDVSKDPELTSLIERLILTFVPLVTRGSIEFLEMTKISQSEIEFAYHQAALSFQETLLKKASLTFEEYSGVLSQLYLNGLIENAHTIFWCEYCAEERTSYYEHHGSMAPSKMSGRTCRECGRPESFSAVFKVDPLLLDSTFSRNHLLGVYLAWRLKDANLDPELGKFVGNQEVDAVVGDSIIECKTFRMGGRDDTTRTNLEQTILQMKTQVRALTEAGMSIRRSIVFWNQPRAKRQQIEVIKNVIQAGGLPSTSVYSYEDIDEMIRVLSQH